MNLLDAALQITRKIPDTPKYLHERDFCWLAIGRAAMSLGNDDALREALAALPEDRPLAELRLATISSRKGPWRDLLIDFLIRLPFWEDYLFRGELSDLAKEFTAHFGVAELSGATAQIQDAFTRTTMLVQLADATRDPVMKRSLLSEAREQARGVVAGNYDYALKHVAGGYLEAQMFDDAREAIDAMREPEIQLDYLKYLEDALATAGDEEGSSEAAAVRGRLAAENPDTQPQSEVLAAAEVLVNLDLDPEFPSSDTIFKRLKQAMDAGDTEQAVEYVRSTFPTRVCPPALDLPAAQLSDLLIFQLERVASYRLNDLKVEFLTDLATSLHRINKPMPAAVIEFIESPDFLGVAPAATPSIHSVDPSTLDFHGFLSVLFDRPVAETEEEQRIFRRERSDDPDVSDIETLVVLSTRLLRQFGQLAPQFTALQVDQAMWALLGYPFGLWDALQSGKVPSELTVACIQAGYHVFADYVARQDLPESVTKFHMWWDEFWRFRSPAAYQALLEAMTRVLEIPDEHSQTAALHGLNHLIGRDAPIDGAREAIDAWLTRERRNLSSAVVQYAEACREGRAL